MILNSPMNMKHSNCAVYTDPFGYFSICGNSVQPKMRSVALLLVLTVITATLAEDDIEIEILDLFGVVTNKAGTL